MRYGNAMVWLLVAVGAWLAPMAALAGSVQNDLANCAKQESKFDDPSSINHKYVSGPSSERLYLYPEHPSLCAAENKGACKGSAYLVAEDAVAVGNVCGKWAFVQFEGENGLSRGWVEARRLTSVVPHPLRDPDAMVDDEDSEYLPTTYKFSLIEGHGRPVCEAYLRRLNASSFSSPPYCGRPENSDVPGFSSLHRVQLPLNELKKLFAGIYHFTFAYRPEVTATDLWSPETLRQARGLQAWRYKPSVSIGNDGEKDDVVIWRGVGASDGDSVCGVYTEGIFGGDMRGNRQLAYVLTADNARVDEGRTREYFGHPIDQPGMVKRPPIKLESYRPIGYSIGIFEYDGLYYFDTFLDGWGDFKGQRMGDPSLYDTLAVFLRTHNRTNEVCEFSYKVHSR